VASLGLPTVKPWRPWYSSSKQVGIRCWKELLLQKHRLAQHQRLGSHACVRACVRACVAYPK
jgi:hypothetical protein